MYYSVLDFLLFDFENKSKDEFNKFDEANEVDEVDEVDEDDEYRNIMREYEEDFINEGFFDEEGNFHEYPILDYFDIHGVDRWDD